MNANTFTFVELKSFGDLVIAASSLRLIAPEDLNRSQLVIGNYLEDLCHVLAPPCKIIRINIPEFNIPAIFDIKKSGLLKGFKSAKSLRSRLANIAPETTFVMESKGLRERLIVGHRRCLSIPYRKNVYLGFEAFVSNNFASQLNLSELNFSSGIPKIAICPFSRVATKNLPNDLIKQLASVCKSAGLEIEVIQLEGEIFINDLSLTVRKIPRSFEALAEALSDYGGVISADSLPAHLAEYFGVPAFIVSPTPNTYWLPLGAFKNRLWGEFNNRKILIKRLDIFFNKIF